MGEQSEPHIDEFSRKKSVCLSVSISLTQNILTILTTFTITRSCAKIIMCISEAILDLFHSPPVLYIVLVTTILLSLRLTCLYITAISQSCLSRSPIVQQLTDCVPKRLNVLCINQVTSIAATYVDNYCSYVTHCQVTTVHRCHGYNIDNVIINHSIVSQSSRKSLIIVNLRAITRSNVISFLANC